MTVVYSCGHEAPLQVNDGLLAPKGGRPMPVDYPCKACVIERTKAHKQQALDVLLRPARRYWVDADGMAHIGPRDGVLLEAQL